MHFAIPFATFSTQARPGRQRSSRILLVLAAPITEGDVDGEAALGGLIALTAVLQWDLTVRGFFLRGGVTVGKVHLREGLLFGPALVDAYDIETQRAVHPR